MSRPAEPSTISRWVSSAKEAVARSKAQAFRSTAFTRPAALDLPKALVSFTASLTAAEAGTSIQRAWARPLRSTARTGGSSLARPLGKKRPRI